MEEAGQDMFETKRETGPMTQGERNFLAFFLAVVLGLFAAEIIHDYRPIKLTALFFLLWWAPLLVLHEAGHALVATVLGWHVGRVVIGFGRLVHKFKVGQTVVELRLIPLEGFIEPVPRNLHSVRLKSALIYFAGCGAELVLLGLVVLVVGLDTMVSTSDNIAILAAQSMAVVVLFTCFVNLVPHAASVNGVSVANDGLGIIRSFQWPESRFAEQVGATYDEEAGEWVVPDPADWWKRR
jgi:hypothetical protein